MLNIEMTSHVIFVPDRNCRLSSVEKLCNGFRAFAAASSAPFECSCEAHTEDPTAVIVRVMEGQEQHGRHQLIVPRSEREVYVELASYAYGSAPTRHIAKFESNALDTSHKLTIEVFLELQRVALCAAAQQQPRPLRPFWASRKVYYYVSCGVVWYVVFKCMSAYNVALGWMLVVAGVLAWALKDDNLALLYSFLQPSSQKSPVHV